MRYLLRTNDSLAQFVVRIALGCVMFVHGTHKTLGWFGGTGFKETFDLFTTKLGFYAWVPIAVIVTEFLGSILLVLGFYTRIAALAIGIMLSSCAYYNHIKYGFFMNWFSMQGGEGFEYHILAVGMALALVCSGGGMFSVDLLFAKKEKKFFI